MKILDSFNKLIEKVCFVLMIIMLLVTFIQFVNRYIFRSSFFWAEEAAILCMIWITFLGGTIAIRRNAHTRIDFLVNMLPPLFKRIIESVGYIFMTIFLIYLGYLSLDILRINNNVLTIGLKIPRSIMYGSLTVGTILMSIYLIILTICKIINYDLDGGVN